MYLLPKAIRDRISSTMIMRFSTMHSYFSNNRGGWNKHGGGAKVAKSINVEGGIFWKKLVHNCNKRGMEGGKNPRNQ